MNPQSLFCPNPACPSRGIEGGGNLRVHDSLRERWRCGTCQKTFSARQGTPFHGLKTDPATVTLVVTLLAHGCPVQAVVAAFDFDPRTVAVWQRRAGEHCQRVHQALVSGTPMDLREVQADEIRVRCQKRRVVWMALALCVPTRLWLGGVVSPTRDRHLARLLARLVAACARLGPLLLLTDGWTAYKDAWRKAFRTPVRTGRRGRPRLLAWGGVVVGQMVKAYARGRAVGIEQRLISGTAGQLAALLPGGRQISTAYVERLNATFRQRLAPLVRRGRCLARLPQTLEAGMYLVGCLYNFGTPHHSLSEERPTTPAMKAGLTDRIWGMGELLSYRVAPPPFVPRKRRGRCPKAQVLVPKEGGSLVTA